VRSVAVVGIRDPHVSCMHSFRQICAAEDQRIFDIIPHLILGALHQCTLL
jgi:hypothetical protein